MSILGTVDSLAGGIVDPVGGLVSGLAGSASGFVLQGISSWVLNGTKQALEEVAAAIGAATAPNLDSTWFSSTYWRVAALAALLTIPFLCAAAVQAVARADLGLLLRVTFGYLPLSLVGVSLAAPLTMLLLAATDQMSSAVSSSAAGGGARFLDHAAVVAGGLATAAGGSPFFAVVVGLLAVMAAMALAVELLMRAAAVYVVVLMLPLAFAALVWPARRIWAVRTVELLASLILSKFVIVAVLSLAAAAFTHGTPGIGELLVAMSLILLSTFSPWALMRILPFTELASGAAGILRNELPRSQASLAAAAGTATGVGDLATALPARLRDHARSMYARTASGEQNGSTPSSAAKFSEPAVGFPASPTAQDSPPDSGTLQGPAGVTPQASGARDDPREPWVTPPAWRSGGPVRLDGSLLLPSTPPEAGEEPAAPATEPSGDRPESGT